jgi:phosphoribosylglycinamide formyltransferase-1
MPTAVLASGNGTNLQAVIDAVAAGILPLDLRVVISNDPDAFAIERAVRAGIAVAVLPFRRHEEPRAAYAQRLARVLQEAGARLVLLLGWMHVLAPDFLEAGFAGVLNLHPSYLPQDPSADRVTFPDGSELRAFRGPHALRDALKAGVAQTGASLIEITSLVDRGPVLARKALHLRPDDDEASALERLHIVEQEVVREGILRWLEGRKARAALEQDSDLRSHAARKK